MKVNLLLTIGLTFLISCQVAEKKNQKPVAVSGIYPHLAMFNNSKECGQGAVVPWADRLWVVTYSPHKPFGSDDKLYEIDEDLNMIARKESIGGTPANRMIHRASQQLIIGSYFIDNKRNIRVIPYQRMPGRMTATAAHLTDPDNKVYLATMEEGLYEVNVHNLAVKVLYPDGNTNKQGGIDQPWLPGTHGKGAYTGQGVLVYANNGDKKAGDTFTPFLPSGCLAAWDGKEWTVIERKQFTEVTGPGGIYGNARPEDPLWALGWDRRSVILKLLDHHTWYTYRLPKADFSYDARNGWFTEWPRIREIDQGRMLMTMSGMFWEFPKTFSATHDAGIRPFSSYLKIIGDFACWRGDLVFACDDASLMDNPYAGQSQSNLWFVKPEDLTSFGPAYGYGGVWIEDTTQAGIPSDPYLVNGFDRVMIHLANGSAHPVTFTIEANSGKGTWEEYKKISVPAGGYQYFIFPEAFRAQWLRLTTDHRAGPVTAYFFTSRRDTRQTVQHPEIFASLPEINGHEGYSLGLIRPRGKNRGTLQFAAQKRDPQGLVSKTGYYEVDETMKIRRMDDKDSLYERMQKDFGIENDDFETDQASVIVKGVNGRRYRLPYGDTAWIDHGNGISTRGLREVVTERSLLNCEGTFYVVPRASSGGYGGIKPVCTHNRIIYDFCSWRGMMVISGNRLKTAENGNYFKSDDGKTGLWFGTIDDLWKLGKPHGQGGPWLKTTVKAGEPSDPYLMTGYDKKTLELWADRATGITAEICLDPGMNNWYVFRKFSLKANEKTTYTFPAGFEAHWIRFRSEKDCRVTTWLMYR